MTSLPLCFLLWASAYRCGQTFTKKLRLWEEGDHASPASNIAVCWSCRTVNHVCRFTIVLRCCNTPSTTRIQLESPLKQKRHAVLQRSSRGEAVSMIELLPTRHLRLSHSRQMQQHYTWLSFQHTVECKLSWLLLFSECKWNLTPQGLQRAEFWGFYR